MYQKILVPLDGSEDSEQVLPVVQDVLTLGGEVLLIKIVQPIQTRIAAGPCHGGIRHGGKRSRPR